MHNNDTQLVGQRDFGPPHYYAHTIYVTIIVPFQSCLYTIPICGHSQSARFFSYLFVAKNVCEKWTFSATAPQDNCSKYNNTESAFTEGLSQIAWDKCVCNTNFTCVPDNCCLLVKILSEALVSEVVPCLCLQPVYLKMAFSEREGQLGSTAFGYFCVSAEPSFFQA